MSIQQENWKLVPYDISMKLKKLGFNEQCFSYYSKLGEAKIPHFVYFNNLSNKEPKECLAPTPSQVFDWFEKTYQIFPMIVVDQTSYPKYAFEIAQFFGNPKDLSEIEWGWKDNILSQFLYKTRLEAEIDCIKKVLEIIENG